MFHAILGVTAGVVQVLAIIPYLRDIFLGKTKPERAAFWIFFLLIAITLAAQLADGGSWAMILIGISVLYAGTIAVLSLKYGYGTFKLRDKISVAIALIGLGLWLVTSQPLLAVVIIILVDIAGFWLVLVKAWEAPHTETLISWAASAIAATLVVIAVGKFEAVQISYVLYSAIANWMITLLLIYRRRIIKPTPS